MHDKPDPFYTAPPLPCPGRGRLLVLSYHFPPGQGAGALRWQKLARFAAERGWGLDVVTLDPSDLRSPDMDRLDELPPGIRVFGIPAMSAWLDEVATTAAGLLRRLRSSGRGGSVDPTADPTGRPSSVRPESLGREEMERGMRTRRDLTRGYHAWREYVRDGRWARAAGELAADIVSHTHRAVISCGPPHMVHIAGLSVSQRTGLPLVVDMRDPWSLVQRLPESIASPIWLRLARRYERRAVAGASLLVANTEPAATALKRSYPDAADRIIAVMNGYDEDPFPTAPDPGRFTIAYAGTIYLDRDPTVLFGAVAAVIDELELKPSDLAIELMGHVRSYNGQSVRQIAAAHGLEDFIVVHRSGPRRAAMAFMSKATLLVSLPQDSDLAIPSKIYEYMRHDAWILALSKHDSATGSLLAQTGADVVHPADRDGVTRVIRRRILQYRRGDRPRSLAADHRLSRAHQASALFDSIERLVDESEVEGPTNA